MEMSNQPLQQQQPPREAQHEPPHVAQHVAPHEPQEENAIPADLPRVGTRVIAGVAIAFVVLLAAMFAIGYFPNRSRHHEAAQIASKISIRGNRSVNLRRASG